VPKQVHRKCFPDLGTFSREPLDDSLIYNFSERRQVVLLRAPSFLLRPQIGNSSEPRDKSRGLWLKSNLHQSPTHPHPTTVRTPLPLASLGIIICRKANRSAGNSEAPDLNYTKLIKPMQPPSSRNTLTPAICIKRDSL
jgi:hypothetical protein